jgi:hypothetical protein
MADLFLLRQITRGPAKHAKNTKRLSRVFVYFVGNKFDCG